MKKIFIDIETTGLNHKKDKIHQLSGSLRTNGKIIKEFDLKGSESKIYKSLIKILDKYINKYDKTDKAEFIAYNAVFDTSFVRTLFLKNGNKFYGSYFNSQPLCVMQMSKFYFRNRKKKPKSFKLDDVCRFFKIRVQENKLHDGLYDIQITRKLYNKLDKLL